MCTYTPHARACVCTHPTHVHTPTHMHTHVRPPSPPAHSRTHEPTRRQEVVRGKCRCGAAWGSPIPQGLSWPALGPQPGSDLGLQTCTTVRAAPYSHHSAARPESRGPSSEAVHTDRLSEQPRPCLVFFPPWSAGLGMWPARPALCPALAETLCCG